MVKKGFLIIVMAVSIAVLAPTAGGVLHVPGYTQAVAAERDKGMQRLNLILKKLRDAMGSMKDFDELEKAGLRKKDVDRMRQAMRHKIQQMMEDAIYAIRAL